MVHLLLSSHQGKCTQEIFIKCLHCVFKIERCSVGDAKNSPHPSKDFRLLHMRTTNKSDARDAGIQLLHVYTLFVPN